MSITVEDLLATDDPAPTDFTRDQWDRPLIVPQGGGKPIGYTRCSSAAKTIDDTHNLELWARRNVAYGMAHDRSLVARVLAVGGTPREWEKDGRQAVNKIVEDAQQVAKAHEAADVGTAVHELTHRVDRGIDVIGGPYQDDLDAYAATLTAAGLTTRADWIECRMVCDDLQMAGTADRIFTVRPGSPLARFLGLDPDETVIGDLKTGESIDYGGLGWAAQLAAYAHGSLYDVQNDVRMPTPTINRQRGVIVHLPAGQGRCDLYLVDLEAGYEAARLANVIRETRKAAKTWLEPVSCATPIPTRDDEVLATLEASLVEPPVSAPAELVASTSSLLRARLNAAVAAGARRITWPAGVARFADGGPTSWAEVLEVEQVVLTAETEAQLPFENKLPADPMAPPVEYELLATVTDIVERQPHIDQSAIDEMRALHDALPSDLRHASHGAVIAAGLPTDLRLWREGHREPLGAILQAATAEHAKRKALVASITHGWIDDDHLGIVLEAIATEPDQFGLELCTADEAERLTAVITALDTGAICIAWEDDGTARLASNAATETYVLASFASKAELLVAAREIAALHGRTKPRSATAAAQDPVLAALLLSTSTNKQGAEPA